MTAVGVSENPELRAWVETRLAPENVWYVKRLTANDTGANGTHQAGPYIPKHLLFELLPRLRDPGRTNPRIGLDVVVDSHQEARRVNAIWYNNRTRNETRITGWGGQESTLLDPENTGALCALVFRLDSRAAATQCRIWVCRDEAEEEFLEDTVGAVEPGMPWIHRFGQGDIAGVAELFPKPPCWLEPADIPDPWMEEFPSPKEIIAKTLTLRPEPRAKPDKRLLRRRKCEHDLFSSVEMAWTLPSIHRGFASMDEFVLLAQRVLQRRKARSGISLELHAKTILEEEGLVEDSSFAYNKLSEARKRPDFLFPSAEAYRCSSFPDSRLRMLAVKTTCRDRWRQILNEADRIPRKHLLTLQEGMSIAQFLEVHDARVQLVVPKPLMKAYPEKVRPHLQSLQSFIDEVKRVSDKPFA